jgi:hypothetical protein
LKVRVSGDSIDIMIWRHELEKLSEEHLGMLLYAVNKENPERFYDIDCLCAFKPAGLRHKLMQLEEEVKKEHLPSYRELCTMLGAK